MLFDFIARCWPAVGRKEADEVSSKWINSEVPRDGVVNTPGWAAVRTSKWRCGFGCGTVLPVAPEFPIHQPCGTHCVLLTRTDPNFRWQ